MNIRGLMISNLPIGFKTDLKHNINIFVPDDVEYDWQLLDGTSSGISLWGTERVTRRSLSSISDLLNEHLRVTIC